MVAEPLELVDGVTAGAFGSLTAPTTMSATTVSTTTGGCPAIGAPHREQTRAAAETSAAHSRHLICTHPAATPGTLAG